MTKIKIFTTGGSIDKAYSLAASDFVVDDEPAVRAILEEGNVGLSVEIEPLFAKDSLQITAEDRALLRERVEAAPERLVLITHGTDTMVETAESLRGLPGKVIVLTGAMQPAAFRRTDAAFNVGCAIGALHLLPEGVWVVMNGGVFDPARVRKNTERARFEEPA